MSQIERLFCWCDDQIDVLFFFSIQLTRFIKTSRSIVLLTISLFLIFFFKPFGTFHKNVTISCFVDSRFSTFHNNVTIESSFFIIFSRISLPVLIVSKYRFIWRFVLFVCLFATCLFFCDLFACLSVCVIQSKSRHYICNRDSEINRNLVNAFDCFRIKIRCSLLTKIRESVNAFDRFSVKCSFLTKPSTRQCIRLSGCNLSDIIENSSVHLIVSTSDAVFWQNRKFVNAFDASALNAIRRKFH